MAKIRENSKLDELCVPHVVKDFSRFYSLTELRYTIAATSEHLFKKVDMEFNFKAFLRLVLIIISIEVQLIDWCHLL